MSEAFKPEVKPGWKEYIVCARCGLVMGGPLGFDHSSGWKDWAGTNSDAICSKCGASGTESLFHCSDLMSAIEKAGWPNPDEDPGSPPWKESGEFSNWTIPQKVRDILLNN